MVTAARPTGTKVLSGGGQSRARAQSVVADSNAPGGNRVWRVFENNTATVPGTLAAHASTG